MPGSPTPNLGLIVPTNDGDVDVWGPETIVSGTAACTTLGTASQVAVSQPFMAKNGTAIQYTLTNANVPLYQARVAIYQESTN